MTKESRGRRLLQLADQETWLERLSRQLPLASTPNCSQRYPTLYRESLVWGLTGNQLRDIEYSGRSPYLAVRRFQLTWRVIGYAEAFGLRVELIIAVVDALGKLRVTWHNEPETFASILAWRKAEQRLGLAWPAMHCVQGKSA